MVIIILDRLIVEDERKAGEDSWIAYMTVVKFAFRVDTDMNRPNIDHLLRRQ